MCGAFERHEKAGQAKVSRVDLNWLEVASEARRGAAHIIERVEKDGRAFFRLYTREFEDAIYNQHFGGESQRGGHIIAAICAVDCAHIQIERLRFARRVVNSPFRKLVADLLSKLVAQ